MRAISWISRISLSIEEGKTALDAVSSSPAGGNSLLLAETQDSLRFKRLAVYPLGRFQAA